MQLYDCIFPILMRDSLNVHTWLKLQTLKPYRAFSEISIDIYFLYTFKAHQSYRAAVKSEK